VAACCVRDPVSNRVSPASRAIVAVNDPEKPVGSWTAYTAALWASVFAVFHGIWAAGWYPLLDGEQARIAFASPWKWAFDVVVAAMCVVAVPVVLAGRIDDFQASGASVRAPALYLRGDDDRLVPESAWQRMAALRPVTTVRVPGPTSCCR
jgi:pimeloyl-ACP methyl ester carboxylesterase